MSSPPPHLQQAGEQRELPQAREVLGQQPVVAHVPEGGQQRADVAAHLHHAPVEEEETTVDKL